MKSPFDARAPSFDANAILATIQRALASAGLDTTAGPMHDVTETIRRALSSGLPAEAGVHVDDAAVIDVATRVVPHGDAADAARQRTPLIREVQQRHGRFETYAFSNDAGTRAYKVYEPAGPSDVPRAMIVMLHGCTQSADDFAAGTQMNRLADEHGFLVVYPEQAAQANASKCWNWFNPQDQQRGAGEPSLIAGIAIEVARRHDADPSRVYVAGLSAGAAMAVVLGESYPELFAGVGVHSGLPYASAHDIPSALAAMKGGRSGMPELRRAAGGAESSRRKAVRAVPAIVFHGDRDHTVQHTNGAHIVQQARAAHGAQLGDSALRVTTHCGVTPNGRRFSRTVHADNEGQVRIESWTLHGGGHAWSGGHASGTYTDGSGPDASAEMVRFFMALPRAGSVMNTNTQPDGAQRVSG